MSPKRSWNGVLDEMLSELGSAQPRAETYWAQQLAFAPVFVHAVALAVRSGELDGEDARLVRDLVPLALAMLGALPDGCAGDPATLQLLARRQASALAWGRRRHLRRLAERIGGAAPEVRFEPVPRRFLRPYPLLGWSPPEPS